MKKKSTSLAYLEGWLSIFINILLFGIKYWAGIVTKSVAIIADAWHTLSDSLSSIVVLIGVRTTTKPADRKHPFGHGRAELVASVIIGVILGVVAFNFLVESISRLSKHQSASFGTLAVVVVAVSVLLKEGIAQFSFWAARKTKSLVLKADGWHHRSDAITSLLILIGIFLGKYFWWIDGVLGIIVAFFILYAAYGILKDATNPLLGERPDEELVTRVKEISERFAPSTIEAHHLHLHRYGEHRELTFHIYLDGAMSLDDAHTIATSIENAIREELEIEATIHVDPLEEN
ncbi:MAG: cation diffusion facilitator family transporter [Candidatus Aminicenantes bacterium]|nr:cation diffusion facilitator family transporter [Candidatus Aminicenantes bacterium]NIM80856.1 cation diffusion facilitator family transporter [Candidatus Aminicenantes bacterium]NIN20240.1 cation diffusion facilitator family transporter [Candidatus Aminicenantes bacterium]NIN44019.1 cation diffusion facilitator family transporter [Candidatus Aminicenantes bacterium]NIN86829.1 cation diffusion facilitator family transporter [Candidatus Aminicenantes bacterium]